MNNKLSYGKYQKKIFLICGLGWMCDNLWMTAAAIVLPRVQVHWSIADSSIGILSSMLFAGSTFGNLCWGIVSDKYGRKLAFDCTFIITTICGLLVGFSTSFIMLCILLFALGFGVGGNLPVNGSLFLEFLPQDKRQKLSLLSIFFAGGAVVASIVGRFWLPAYSCQSQHIADCPGVNNNGWRYTLISLGILNLLFALFRCFCIRLFETPRFLFSTGKIEEAMRVLQRVANENGEDVAVEANYPLEGLHIDDSATQTEEITGFGLFQNLLRKKYFLTTILLWFIWFFCNFGFTMFNVFLPKLLEHKSHEENVMGNITKSLDSLILYSVSGIPGSVLCTWLVDTKLGRKGTMGMSISGTVLGLFLFTIAYGQIWLALASAFFNFCSSIMYAAIYAYTPEVYPTFLRTTGTGVASSISRIAGVIAPFMAGFLYEKCISLPSIVSATSMVLGVFAVSLLPIETRDNAHH